ncbi:peptide transporter family 1-like [Sergentomyia squamirostris]
MVAPLLSRPTPTNTYFPVQNLSTRRAVVFLLSSLFPKGVIFILASKLSESLAFYGVKAILPLYMRMELGYSDDLSTEIFHTFVSLVYFFPLFGAIVADSCLGKFKTIFILSIVFAFGSVIITLGAIPPLNLPVKVITMVALLMIAMGTGGIKPCMASLGGDQFKLPEQAVAFSKFFSLFYFIMNAGAFLATLATPTLRENGDCFGMEDCYSLAFGIPAILMIIAIVIFVAGKGFYKILKPTGNMVVLVSKCIRNAITTRSKERKTNPRDHWLEYAEPKYGKGLVRDVKILLKILVLYLPLPFFWALFEQQSTRWVFQATRMDGRIGGITITPDQMRCVNPVFNLIFIPLFDVVIYPLLMKIGIKRPLQRLTIGGILAAVAFVISGLLELKLDSLNLRPPETRQLTTVDSIHMFWQIPQYAFMGAAEVVFGVTGLEFSYSQAPLSMKSVLQACWHLTVAVGNVIVVFFAFIDFIESQALEFFLFAAFMIIDMGIFVMLAMRYDYVEPTEDECIDEEIGSTLEQELIDNYDDINKAEE